MRNTARVRRSRIWFDWAKILALVAFVSTPFAQAQAAEGSLPAVPPELEKVRAQLERYRDPVAAIHDGYFSTLACIYLADGGMGVHFLNLGKAGPVPDPMAPTILVYAPEGGKLRLVAAEWLVPLATGIKDRPRLFGQQFHGPMEGHEPLQPKELHHYDLHVWLFDDNPAGLFNDTNRNVECAGKWPYAHLAEHPKIVPHE